MFGLVDPSRTLLWVIVLVGVSLVIYKLATIFYDEYKVQTGQYTDMSSITH